MPHSSSPRLSKSETAPKILSAINFITAGATADATAENVKCQKIYHFPDKQDIERFKQALQDQKTSDKVKHQLLQAIFIKIYGNQGNIPSEIKSFLCQSADITDEAAKQIFMVLDNTAGYNKDESSSNNHLGHSGVDLVCFGEKFRHEFFRLRQHCFKEEIYIGKKGDQDIKLQCFSGTPHADLHAWKPTSQNKFQISAWSFSNTLSVDHRIKAYKLLISSYISALEDANNYVIDKSKNNELITKLQTNLNNTSQNPLDYQLELHKDDLRTIQEANCILKLAGARRAGKNLVLMPPGVFAPEGLKFDERKNKFSEFIKTALSKMEEGFRPDKVLINAENGVLIELVGQSGHETKINQFKSLNSLNGIIKINYDNPNPFKSLLGEDYLVDLCSANFPMSMFSFSVSQGKIPDEKEKTAEESLRGTANRICCLATRVEIFDGERKVGETEMGLQTTFFDKECLEQTLIKNQDQSSDFLTSLKSINANNFDDICNSPSAKEEDNKILLYLFLDDLEKEGFQIDASLLSKIKIKLQEKEIEEIKEKIQLHSLSESLNPPIYEGWGVAFNQADIDVREENVKVFLLVKIDKIFPNSKLEGVEKDDSIKIELNKQDINELKTDGKFNVGKVAKLIRGQKSLTIQKTTGIVTFEESKKSHFYKDQDDNYIGFSKSENQGKAINAIKTAFQNLLEPVVPEEGSAVIPSPTPIPQSLGLGTGTGSRSGCRPSS